MLLHSFIILDILYENFYGLDIFRSTVLCLLNGFTCLRSIRLRTVKITSHLSCFIQGQDYLTFFKFTNFYSFYNIGYIALVSGNPYRLCNLFFTVFLSRLKCMHVCCWSTTNHTKTVLFLFKTDTVLYCKFNKYKIVQN